MVSPLRRLRTAWRRLLSVRTSTLDGIRLITAKDRIPKIVRNGIFKETYEEPEKILIRAALRPGDRVLEVGGGVGFISLFCAKIVGANNVLTYEANPAMQEIILENYQLNDLAPTLRVRAVTAHGGDITLFVNTNIVSSSFYHREGGGAAIVPSDALDAVLAEWRPTVLVMDVEGAEVDILSASALAGLRALILELHPHIVGNEALVSMRGHLAKHGFRESRALQKSVLFLRS